MDVKEIFEKIEEAYKAKRTSINIGNPKVRDTEGRVGMIHFRSYREVKGAEKLRRLLMETKMFKKEVEEIEEKSSVEGKSGDAVLDE